MAYHMSNGTEEFPRKELIGYTATLQGCISYRVGGCVFKKGVPVSMSTDEVKLIENTGTGLFSISKIYKKEKKTKKARIDRD